MPNGMNNYALLQAINKSGGGGGNDKPPYTTDERVIGKWEDDKPLYEKTYVFTKTGWNAINQDNMTGYFINDIDLLINIDTIIMAHNSPIGDLPLNEYRGKKYVSSYVNRNNEIIISQNITNSAAGVFEADLRITIQYTKTTD